MDLRLTDFERINLKLLVTMEIYRLNLKMLEDRFIHVSDKDNLNLYKKNLEENLEVLDNILGKLN